MTTSSSPIIASTEPGTLRSKSFGNHANAILTITQDGMLAANETSNGNEIMRVELSSVTLKQPRWRNTSIVIQTPDGKVTYTLRTLLVVFGLVGFILLRRKTKALGAFVMQAQSMQAAR